MPNEFKAGNPSLYKEALLKNMIGYSRTARYSSGGRQRLQGLVQFEPSVKAAGKMDEPDVRQHIHQRRRLRSTSERCRVRQRHLRFATKGGSSAAVKDVTLRGRW
jgi:hypothetical protein